jgi:hypothetical protein
MSLLLRKYTNKKLKAIIHAEQKFILTTSNMVSYVFI